MSDVTCRLLVIQAWLPEYRVPFFDRLGADAGLDVTVLHSGRALARPSLSFREVAVPANNWLGLRTQPGAVALIRSADVVVGWFDPRWLSVVEALRSSPERTILWGHGYGRRRFARPIRSSLARRAAAVLLYEENDVAPFTAIGVAHAHFVGNTLEVPDHGVMEADRAEFLFVGRLTKRKRVVDLVEAFALAAGSLPDSARVTIVGEGEGREAIERTAARLAVEDRVRLLGATFDPMELREHFGRALAYVSPGHVGLGVLHAFAYGVPVVTARGRRHAPEFHNLEDGRNALLYDGTVSSLAGVLGQLASTPALSMELGRHGYERYSTERTIDLMVGRFKSAVMKVFHEAGARI